MTPTTESVLPLAARWAAGDRGAGNELIARHDDWIRAYARRKALPWEEADDLAQMMRVAFMDAAVKMGPGSDGETRSFLRWAMRETTSARRAAERRRPMAHIEPPASCLCAGDGCDRCADNDNGDDRFGSARPSHDDLCDASRLIDSSGLSADERAIILSRCVFESFLAETEAEFSCPRTTVVRRYEKAMARLRFVAGCSGATDVDLPRQLRDCADTDARVLEFIDRCGPVSGNALKSALKLGQYQYWTSVDRLAAAGKVIKNGPRQKMTYSVAEQKTVAA